MAQDQAPAGRLVVTFIRFQALIAAIEITSEASARLVVVA